MRQSSHAVLCARRVERVEVDGQQPSWFDVRPVLEHALVSRACFDITSLVYAFLQRGGVLTP